MARYFYIKDNVHNREKVVDAPPRSQILFDEIDAIVGDKQTWFGIPYAIEVDSWGEDCCCEGDIYQDEDEQFLVECITEEEYRNW